jgi:hypothetical protein
VDVADLTLANVSHAEVVDNLTHKSVLLLNINLELQSGGESECLTYGEGCEEDVILHDICRILLESLLVNRNLVVEENITGESGGRRRGHSISQDVEQRCLTSA